MFIYKITNLINGKVIIGQTTRAIKYRWSHYLYCLRKNTHYNKHLQASWNKYGESNFKFELIDTVAFVWGLDNLERFWIKHYDSTNPAKGYNRESGGNSNKVMTEETKKKLSASLKGLVPWQKGKARTAEASRKQSLSMMGKPAWNKGIPMSEEQKELISKVKTGTPNIKGRKQVRGINLETLESCIFDSVTAAADFLNSSPGSISAVCSTKRKNHKGWIFSYIEKVGG